MKLQFYLIISMFKLVELLDSSTTPCCVGETWTSCPCVNSPLLSTCCDLNFICVGGGGCLSNSFKEFVELQGKVTDKNCDYYPFLESTINCGDKGYPMQFGNKYCKKYLDKIDSFKDKQWQNAVRKCLQNVINIFVLNKITSGSTITCEELDEYAFDSHVNCYTQPDPKNSTISWCKIPLLDKFKIINIARYEVLNYRFITQVMKLYRDCKKTVRFY